MKIVGCFLKGKIHHNLKEDNIFCVLLETGSQPWVMSNSLCSQSFALNPLLLYCYYHYYFETGSQCVVLAFLELSEVCLFLPLLSAGIKDVYNFLPYFLLYFYWLIYLFIVCIGIWLWRNGQTCHCTWIEVKGHLMEVHSLFPPCVPTDWTQVVKIGTKPVHLLSWLTGLSSIPSFCHFQRVCVCSFT